MQCIRPAASKPSRSAVFPTRKVVVCTKHNVRQTIGLKRSMQEETSNSSPSLLRLRPVPSLGTFLRTTPSSHQKTSHSLNFVIDRTTLRAPHYLAHTAGNGRLFLLASPATRCQREGAVLSLHGTTYGTHWLARTNAPLRGVQIVGIKLL